MKAKSSIYTFPHKSKISIINYLLAHENYGGWNHPNRKWCPFSWNVKVYSCDVIGGRESGIGEPIDPLLDELWKEYLRTDNNCDKIFNLALEEASRYLLDGEYTTYPGDDQGDWRFAFGGRSGGHLILKQWKNVDFLSRFDGKSDFRDWLEELQFPELKTLYKGIRCMDADFSKANAIKAVNYQINFQRTLWEEEIRNESRKEIYGTC